MNLLKTYTSTTELPDTFLIYWTNSVIQPKGILRVRIQPEIRDGIILAELAAMRHLLEDKGVAGKNIIGNAFTKLVVSSGAIRKLQAMRSDKHHLAPYANFLTTRFAGSWISVSKETLWFDGFQPECIEELQVTKPCREAVRISGLGEVSVTHHALERIADRLLAESDRSAQAAWKKLVSLASDPLVHEVSRQGFWAGIRNGQQGKQEGRYFLNPKSNLILVVTDNHGEGKRLVTIYPATRHFQTMPKAA